MAKHGTMTKSPVTLAKYALKVAQKALPSYSASKSRHDFNQAQLFAILSLREFFQTDYRSLMQYLQDFTDLRTTLGLSKIPHFTTLQKAHQRLIKKGLFTA